MLWKYLSTTVFESLMMSLDSPGYITEYWQMELMKNVVRAPPRDGDTMIAVHWGEGSACPWSETRSRMGVPICAKCRCIVSQLQIDSSLLWFVILELDPLTISPLPTGQMLTSSQEGFRMAMQGESSLLLSSGFRVLDSALPSSAVAQWPVQLNSGCWPPAMFSLLVATSQKLFPHTPLQWQAASPDHLWPLPSRMFLDHQQVVSSCGSWVPSDELWVSALWVARGGFSPNSLSFYLSSSS